MRIRQFTISPPERDLPIMESARVLAQTLSASASYETVVHTAHSAVRINAIKVTPDAVITGVGASGAGATLFINRYNSAGTKQGADGAVASLAFNSGTNAVAFAQTDLGTLKVTTLNKGDVLTFKWLQGATGLALPAARCEVNYSVAGSNAN